MNYDFKKLDFFGIFQFYFDDWWENDVDVCIKYMFYIVVFVIFVIGFIIQVYDNMKYMDDYIQNRGIGYDEIFYFSCTQGAQGFGLILNYVFKNIYRLYL